MAQGSEYKPSKEHAEVVRCLSAAGLTQEFIAKCIGLNPKTLRKNYDIELEHGREFVTGRAVRQLAAAIDRGESWAICFYLKCRAGWQEKQVLQHEGPDGGPIKTSMTVRFLDGPFKRSDDSSAG